MSATNYAEFALIAMPGIDGFVDRVAHHLRYNDKFCRINAERVDFASTEHKPIIAESVRNRTAYLFADLSTPTVSEAVMRTDLMLNALESNHIDRIYLMTPYSVYARQDHHDIDVRSALSAKALISQFTRYKTLKQIISVDLHAPQLEGFGEPGQVENLSGMLLFGNYFCDLYNNDFSNVTMVSPDVGGLKRVRSGAESFSGALPVGSIDKRRKEANVATPLTFIGSPEDIEGTTVEQYHVEFDNYLLNAGLEQILAYLTNWEITDSFIKNIADKGLAHETIQHYQKHRKFTGTVNAIPEGIPIFGNEPVISIRTNFEQGQLPESTSLGIWNYETAVATTASYVKSMLKAFERDRVITLEGGSRRCYPGAAVAASRAALIGGFDGTSNMGILDFYSDDALGMVGGSSAHSAILHIGNNEEAFEL